MAGGAVSDGETGRTGRGRRREPCHSLCPSIEAKRVATGSHGLHESVLFGLLTHQLKATDCNGLDGSDHPLKVKTRVRTPYGLPARNSRSAATFGAVTIAREAAAATHFATQSGRTPSTRSTTWAVARRGVLGRCRSAELVMVPWTDRNIQNVVSGQPPRTPRGPSSRWGAALASTPLWESMTLTRPHRGRPRGPTHGGHEGLLTSDGEESRASLAEMAASGRNGTSRIRRRPPNRALSALVIGRSALQVSPVMSGSPARDYAWLSSCEYR
jgi:hypothetical protein